VWCPRTESDRLDPDLAPRQMGDIRSRRSPITGITGLFVGHTDGVSLMGSTTVADAQDGRAFTTLPAWSWRRRALGLLIVGLLLVTGFSYYEKLYLMPDYARGWHVGAALRDEPLSHQCSVSAENRYPGLVDPSTGVGHSPQAWAYLAGCVDAQHGFEDMRWRITDRLTDGARGGPED